MQNLSVDRVLVTRSQPGAAALVEALHKAGFVTLCHPMLEIRARPVAPPARAISQYGAVIFVSVHAVEHGMLALNLDALNLDRDGAGQLQWFAVGRTTAAALAAHGVAAMVPDDESSEGILALPALAAVSGTRVLIVAGVGGRTVLAETLSARGARVDTVLVYERAPTAHALSKDEVAQVGAVVISSAEGARVFTDVWRAASGSFRVRVVAPSERVRDTLLAQGFQDVHVSKGASNAAVVAALGGMASSARSSSSRKRGQP